MQLRKWIIGAGVASLALNGALFLSSFYELQEETATALDIAHITVQDGAGNADNVLDRVDRTLSGLSEVLHIYMNNQQVDPLYIHKLLIRRHSITPHLRALFVLSSDGSLIYDSVSSDTKSFNFADRDYARYHLDGGENTLFIGHPVISRVTGSWIIPVSRRVEDRFGRLVAIVAAAFDPNAFVSTLTASGVRSGMRAAMLAPNGDILACYPKADCLGQSAAQWPVFNLQSRHAPSGADAHATYVPGPPGPSAFAVSPKYGITVGATFNADDVLSGWRSQRLWFIALGTTGSGAIIVMSWMLSLQISRRRQAMADLADANAFLEHRVTERTIELRRSEGRLRMLIHVAHDAILILDGQGHIRSGNPAAEALFGYRASELAGLAVGVLFPALQDEDAVAGAPGAATHTLRMENSHELIAVHKSGDEFAVELTIGSGESDGDSLFMGIIRDVRERRAQEEALWRLANYDGLTGVLNRRAFMEKAHDLVELARRYGRPITVFMVDADRFKAVNDTYGHHAGDEVLRALAQAMANLVRFSDVLGRLGGEEFAIVAPETAGAEAESFATRLLEAVRELTVEVDGVALRFSVSIGFASLNEHATVNDLLRDADEALYLAKSEGRDRFVAFGLGREDSRPPVPMPVERI